MKRVGLWLVVGSLWVAGCSFMRPPRTPMERVSFRERGASSARGAIVLLPGFGDRPAAFAEHGFVRVLAKHAPEYDVFAADAHFGYYRKRSLLERLERDVIGPLKQRGYRELWLVGASLGGFGAVAYARNHPEQVRGLLLFAPYLGPSKVVREVAAAGLCSYRPAAAAAKVEDDEESFARANFVWLRRQACEERDVSIYVAVGDKDRLLAADRLLGQALDPSHMLVLPGGHGWKVWTAALERLAPLAFDTPQGSD
jgi:pimeloyl-ACP methyl ester carboxylesterase